MSLRRTLTRVVMDLENANVSFALVGGLAMGVHAEPRFTRDLDFAVSVSSDEDAERLARYLHGRGYITHASVEQRATGRLATLRLWSPGDESTRVAVDLLFASCGIEPEICERAVPLEVLPGVQVPVACVGHLIAMKLLAVDDERIRDAQDLVSLRRVVTDEQLEIARAAVLTIIERGAGRGRDLVGDLEEWVAWQSSRNPVGPEP